jgi:hypothetical protein
MSVYYFLTDHMHLMKSAFVLLFAGTSSRLTARRSRFTFPSLFPGYLAPVLNRFLLLILFLVSAMAASAQWKLQGTVFDSSRQYTVESVLVQSTSGRIVQTNKLGFYSIDVVDSDSVWFTFGGKPTRKYPVKTIPDGDHFDIALRVPVKNAYKQLQEVIVRGKNYRLDSIQNRRDYAKAFDFQRPNIGTMTSIGPGGAGIDINELVRLFQFRKNRSMERFRTRLQQQEQDRFIDYRFNKPLIRRLTGLDGTELDSFAERFRPTLEFTESSSDYEFQLYIRLCYDAWRGKTPVAPPGQ